MSILLTDAEYKQCLAILRALSLKQLSVHCSASRRKSLAFYSKYCKKKFIYSKPTKNPDQFKNDIETIVQSNKTEVLMPIGSASCTLISQQKEKLEKYARVPIANYDTFVKAHDKSIVNELANRNNIPAPHSSVPKNLKELKSSLKDYSFPIVLKARKGTATSQVRYCRNQEETITLWNKFNKIGKGETSGIVDHSYPIIQEYLPGEIIDVLFIFNKGKPRGCLTQRRVITLPVDGGSGALNITINEPTIARDAIKLMKALNWHGVGMAEFKRDTNGNAKLIEVNPKFWGTTECSISAGMNFPYMLYEIAMDGDTKPQFSYLKDKPFGWPFPMGIKSILETNEPFTYIKKFLELTTYKNGTDIRLLSDPRPFSLQLYQTLLSIFYKIYSTIRG
jgi:predicted ATP-grasp superfamily ATP-dependent carboligase